MLTQISKAFWDLLWKLWYPFVTRLSGNTPLTFLNYGYAEDATAPLPLMPQDEPNRPCIQLYHRVVSPVDLRGLDVLEVSCGHGGGAAYIARYLKPNSMLGIDRNATAIALCKQRHPIAGLTFARGDAMDLPFRDHSFDAFVSVEASHCYPDMPRFLRQVRRVLRPGGHFLFADFRQGTRGLALLRQQLSQSGMDIVQYDNISMNVVRGMQLNTPKYESLIRTLVPAFLRQPAMAFAGVKGSAIYKSLDSGETTYLCYHLRPYPQTPDPDH